jgi:hypothetical protein
MGVWPMRSLVELQSEMTRAILEGDVNRIAGELTSPRSDAAARFSIYRNNMFLSLMRHLRSVFPVTARLGDERFFLYAAHQYVRRHPPREVRLTVYGDGFARFLSSFPPAQNAPLLAEMAAFEWAVHGALTAAERPPLAAAALCNFRQGSGQLRLELQPSLGFALSRWPLLSLWKSEGEPDAVPSPRHSRIAVYRHGDNVRVLELTSASFSFWRSLKCGDALDRAAERALARDPQFDLVDEIQALFNAALVTAINASIAE